MSYSIGWAALNLEMPERVPRTEFSLAEYHWPLISRVTGRHVTQNSPADERAAATRALREAWTFDFNWSATARNEYLASFDGGIFASGSHTVVGIVLVRTSDELTASQQQTLEANIIAALTEIVE